MSEVVVTRGEWFTLDPDGRVRDCGRLLVPAWKRDKVLALARPKAEPARAEAWWQK